MLFYVISYYCVYSLVYICKKICCIILTFLDEVRSKFFELRLDLFDRGLYRKLICLCMSLCKCLKFFCKVTEKICDLACCVKDLVLVCKIGIYILKKKICIYLYDIPCFLAAARNNAYYCRNDKSCIINYVIYKLVVIISCKEADYCKDVVLILIYKVHNVSYVLYNLGKEAFLVLHEPIIHVCNGLLSVYVCICKYLFYKPLIEFFASVLEIVCNKLTIILIIVLCFAYYVVKSIAKIYVCLICKLLKVFYVLLKIVYKGAEILCHQGIKCLCIKIYYDRFNGLCCKSDLVKDLFDIFCKLGIFAIKVTKLECKIIKSINCYFKSVLCLVDCSGLSENGVCYCICRIEIFLCELSFLIYCCKGNYYNKDLILFCKICAFKDYFVGVVNRIKKYVCRSLTGSDNIIEVIDDLCCLLVREVTCVLKVDLKFLDYVKVRNLGYVDVNVAHIHLAEGICYLFKDRKLVLGRNC